MSTEHRFPAYFAFEPQDELARTYAAAHAKGMGDERRLTVHQHAEQRLVSAMRRLKLEGKVSHRIVSHPSLDWRLILSGKSYRHRPSSEQVLAVEFSMDGTRIDALKRLHTIRQRIGAHMADCTKVGTGANMSVFTAEYWSPAEATAPLFGNRDAARRRMGITRSVVPTDGTHGVNVVIVDQGIDKDLVERLGGTFGGGWENIEAVAAGTMKPPGKTQGGHGAMMVRNLLDVAPGVTVFDCPLLPPHISGIRSFLSHAHAAYSRMIADIRQLRERDERRRGPWIFVNAWAIYDRASEHPLGDYTENPEHPFNRLIGFTVDQGFDVVFCAGNCGQFCPVIHCGAHDRGPCHSIYGANSHPSVLTVGAVRVDGLWLGYSSQGPGQPRLAREKPDICAPSQFAETVDAFLANTGSSAAAALAAGAVAALRAKCGTGYTPDQIKEILIATARADEGSVWSGQLGNGILDIGAALRRV